MRSGVTIADGATISRYNDPKGTEMRTYNAGFETAYLPRITD